MEEQDEEWLDYSSPCFAQTASNQQELTPENPTEDSQDEELSTSGAEEAEPRDIVDLLHSSYREQPTLSASQCDTDVFIKSSDHWLWGKLVAKLNSVRHTKWDGSCLEYSYHRSLNISPEKACEKHPEIYPEDYGEQIFNILDMNSYQSRTESGDKIDIVNKDEIDYTDRSLYNGKSSSNTSLEDISPELEWSDNDVKDELIDDEENVSISALNESEAASDLAQLPYKELIHLRDELKQYTKQYSDILVVELEARDQYIREKEIKNDFISSFLAVQAKIREASQAAAKKKFTLQSSSVTNHQSLTTTIPYEIQSEGPSPEILEKLIEIMEAIRIDSSNVPSLLTNYILKVLCK